MGSKPSRYNGSDKPLDRKVTSASAWSYIGGVVGLTLISAIGGLDFTPLPDTVEVFVIPILGALTTLVGGYVTKSQNYADDPDRVLNNPNPDR